MDRSLMKPKLRIDVWSDVACPWCYVGKRRLETALKQFPHRESVDVIWRAFELDPAAARELDTLVPYAQRLATKYDVPVTEAQGMIDRMIGVAKEDGLEFRFDRIRPGNTFDAHRVIHFARASGKPNAMDAMKERLLLAYMSEGESIGNTETLARLAGEAGLDATAVSAMLKTDAHHDAVRADEDEARKIGIRGVPFFVLDAKLAVSGAQPAAVLLGALAQAWDARLARATPSAAAASATADDGATCGPEGCA
jgi:predicted DsbA family dithiol-disulfide isomerase